MKKFLFSLPLAVPLAWCLVGCASNVNGTDTSANSTTNATTSATNTATSNVATNSATSNDATSNAATNTSSNATDTTSNTAASTSDSSTKKTYQVVDEAQASYPAAIAAAIHKMALPPPPASMKVPDTARVLFSTSKGDITVELNGKAAPLHVKSFLYLAQKNFYNGTTFHRFADLGAGSGQPARIIQGGDPLSKTATFRAMAGSGGPGYTIPREYNALKHNAMVLAMARTQDPDSAGSQFYFTLDATPFLDKENAQDGVGYTVFGKVLKGQNVVLQLRQDDVLKRVAVLK